MQNLQNDEDSSLLGRRSSRFRARGLGAAAAGLAASTSASPAGAAIIYDLSGVANSGPGTDTIFSVDGSVFGEIEVVFSGMGTPELSLDSPNHMGMTADSTVQFASFSSGGMMATDYLTLLDPGDTVDGSLNFEEEGFLFEEGTVNPSWAPGTTGYAGFVFDNGGSSPLYGWLQVQYDSSGSSFSVLQFAYEDSGAPINAGAVPEPSTALLVGIGLAGLSAVYRKQRRGGNA